MENNKYYTPTIEEFHVGFECEIKNSSHPINFEWEHFKIVGVDDAEISGSLMDWSFYDSYNAIKDGIIRVKYLDKEDIESLGFESIGSGWYNLKKVPGSLGYFLYVRLQKWGDKIYIKAYRQDPATTDFNNCEYCDKEDLVSGAVIKNKSELKRLMKQLGINE